ncbi:hypothetical protein Ahy_A02g009565 isoform D [Arachis hypogaea]|uniref:Uncharacterized protein n=1 Tax=Arachis hypogaea TaxID=3818 RepID=A0A445EHE2_ARAHY|nr:hypothetical protein Ahy_A02g009565 isoform D [Arachis hypogaea]
MESQQFSVVQDFRGLDDDGDNAFHIAAETAKMICENLDWLIVMLRNSDADIEVRKHRSSDIHSRGRASKMSCSVLQANDVENETITPTTGRTSSDGSIENREDIV